MPLPATRDACGVQSMGEELADELPIAASGTAGAPPAHPGARGSGASGANPSARLEAGGPCELGFFESEIMSRRIIEASSDGIQLLDVDGRLLSTNRRGLEVLGFATPEPVLGLSWAALWPPGSQACAANAVRSALVSGRSEFAARGADGPSGRRWWSVVVTPIENGDGTRIGLMAMSRDITRHKLAEERTEWLASHDALTDLANRRLLQPAVQDGIAAADASGEKLAVVLLDVDRFKAVNDQLGHDAGDAVLLAVAARLRQLPAPVELVARLGGDEFVVLLSGIRDEASILAIVDELAERLHDPIEWKGGMLVNRASFGIAVYPDHGASYSELLRHADIALYRAKETGRGTHSFFVPGMQRAIERKAALALRVRASVDQGIAAYYQPKISLADGRVAGFEARPSIGGSFGEADAPLAIEAAFEDANLALLLSERMLDRVIDDMRGWLAAGVAFGRIAINAGGHDLRRGDFAERALRRLSDARIKPSLLNVAVSGGLLAGSEAPAIERLLGQFVAAGVGVALGGFGKDCASLAHLARYPFDTIGIDGSLVHGVGCTGRDDAVVRALLALGSSLGLTVIGEGIETSRQAAFLAAEGCFAGQGEFFGAPVPGRDVPAYVRSQLQAPPPWAPKRALQRTPSRGHRSSRPGPAVGSPLAFASLRADAAP